MDSLSQAALGAAVAVATMGRRTSPLRSIAWGAVAGTLPDLDVLIDHGDPILDMVLHRAESHALLWLTLAAVPLGLLVAALHGESGMRWRWVVAIALALVTHPMLDAMTVYGTRLGLPFTDRPYAVGSVFIIDPLYTLPLLIALGVALRRACRDAEPPRASRRRGDDVRRAALGGLALSTAYLGWGVLAQWHVAGIARESLAARGLPTEQVLVTPTAFNTLLWRVVAIDGEQFHEGYRSLFDGTPTMEFSSHDRGASMAQTLPLAPSARRLLDFSQGYWKLEVRGGLARLSDLRMGQEPVYVFTFGVAERRAQEGWRPVRPAVSLGGRPDLGRAWSWLWRRALGQPLPPPA